MLYEFMKSPVPIQSRVFNLPPVNFDAETLYDLLNTEFLSSPPPILKDVQILEIKTSIEDASISKYFTGVPCHPQSVERLVKQVTEASTVTEETLIYNYTLFATCIINSLLRYINSIIKFT